MALSISPNALRRRLHRPWRPGIFGAHGGRKTLARCQPCLRVGHQHPRNRSRTHGARNWRAQSQNNTGRDALTDRRLGLLQIECCIDEWITRVKTDIPFTTTLYQNEDHICCLRGSKNIPRSMAFSTTSFLSCTI
ncbi:hypothetical protein L208DRAFT_279751 [Tricholoma matsutake]|nr:hypothetical protein L208DRAFT_279751 [Tricholoma matsutake 945]